MADFTRRYEILIDAPVHEVFEYCRDPRHLFEGWPGLKVTEVVAAPEGVGTKFHVEATFAKVIVEQVDRELTEFVPDERIVSKAHACVPQLIGFLVLVGGCSGLSDVFGVVTQAQSHSDTSWV